MISNDKFMEQFKALETSKNFNELLKFNTEKDKEYLESGLFGMFAGRRDYDCKRTL